MRIVILLFVLFSAVPVAADTIRVVTSFSILEDWVRIVGGDRVDVYSIVGRNSDAHAYRPSPSTARKIADTDLLIVNGLGFEGWLKRLIDASGFDGNIVTASRGIDTLSRSYSTVLANGHSHDHVTSDGRRIDPHAWQSLNNAIQYVRNIESALSKFSPKDSEYFSNNAEDYIGELSAIKKEYERLFGTIPDHDRKAVTAHDAFVYLESEYNIELLAPQPGSVGLGSSARRLASLVERVKRENIRAVFLENVVDPRMLEQVSIETGVSIGGHLYSDALSDEDGEAETYVQMMKHNLDTILRALEKEG